MPHATGTAVVAAVLVAAVLHATWNALARGMRDRLAAFTLMGLAAAVCSWLALPLVAVPAAAAWPALAASALLHTAYNLLLLTSYRLGEFNQVYPLARGTGPLLVAAVAATALHERLAAVQLAGVVAVSAGIILLAVRPGALRRGRAAAGGGGRPSTRAAVLAAVATGVMIAAYTVVDGVGVRRSGTAAGYTAWLFALEGPLVPLVALAVRRGGLGRSLRGHWAVGVLCGLLSLTAYGLVIWAQTRGALAAVAALRESSVVIAAGIGALAFHERFGRRRIAASVAIAAGVVLLNLH
jgi:drug/metabolite transporter (DMT)-like permease